MNEIATSHRTVIAWDGVVRQICAEMARRQVQPSRVVLLLPYAQLIAEARRAWLRRVDCVQAQALFLPHFETTMNWSRSLGGFGPSADDVRLDAAHDLMTAASLLSRSGLGAHQNLLAGRLMQAAWSLAHVAAAVPPPERTQWGERLSTELGTSLDTPVLALEAATARIALAWVASSSYPTDAIFAAAPDLLVILEGFQTEPITLALQRVFAERVIVLSLQLPADTASVNSGASRVALHAAQNAEDEAQRAAACVLAQLVAGRSPVALVAQDRLLTRRVRAMLGERGISIRDETGWRLSTTRAAASLMCLLRAGAWDASTDEVLDWLKNAPACGPQAVAELEIELRRRGARDWRAMLAGTLNQGALPAPVLALTSSLREALKATRALTHWLADVRAALQRAGQWPLLLQDAAGQAVLAALRLRDGSEIEFAAVSVRLSLGEFTAWVSQTLEAANFLPPQSDQTESNQVVILPLSQLLGQALAAVVLPGCDERRLPTSPEPSGQWTSAQRALLGLPSRAELATAARAAWHYALQFPQVDVLWRASEAGEHLMPSGFVQELQFFYSARPAPDPRALRALTAQPGAMPHPRAAALPLTRLSSTAYEDLRRCPYRFFALRQMKLQASDELDQALDKRDFGNWLHSVLKIFHEALHERPEIELTDRVALINRSAEQATLALGLSNSEFLPFAAAWPRVRAGYLQWLAAHEASGAAFVAAESWRESPLGCLTLVGKIDRIDRLSDGSALVIDYKTEARTITAERIKVPLEDTQLAFYAALLADDTLAAAYVNVGEKDATHSYVQADIVDLRDQLLEGIASDMAQIAAGAALPALGEGKACEFCEARGLCRKDFWE